MKKRTIDIMKKKIKYRSPLSSSSIFSSPLSQSSIEEDIVNIDTIQSLSPKSTAMSMPIWISQIKKIHNINATNKKIIDCLKTVSKSTNTSMNLSASMINMSLGNIDFDNIGVLEWTGNSCYMDSVLLPLLLLPSKWVDENILYKKIDDPKISSVQQGLLDMKYAMLGGNNLTCTNFRAILRGVFLEGFEYFSGTDMRESAELLKYIFALFENNDSISQSTVYGTNSDKSLDKLKDSLCLFAEGNTDLVLTSVTKYNESPVFYILYDNLVDNEDILSSIYKFTDSGMLEERYLFKTDDGQVFKRRLYKTIPIDYKYFVLYLNRTFLQPTGKMMISRKRIIPTKSINVGSVLSFSAVVIWRSSHYTAYIKHPIDNVWWHYNDTSSSGLQRIGSFDDLLKIPEVLTHSILLFYT